MGYPVQAGAPQIVFQGRTFAVGAFDFANPVGTFYTLGVFENLPAQGGWNLIYTVAMYGNPGDVLAAIQMQGGIVNFIRWIVDKINAFFRALFSTPPPPTTGEPATDDEARLMVTARINAMAITIIDGVPFLQ